MGTPEAVLEQGLVFISTNAMGRTFYDYNEDFFSTVGLENPLFPTSPKHASMVGSLCEDGMHAPVLDVDFAVQLLEAYDGKSTLILDAWPKEEDVRTLDLIVKETGAGREARITNRGGGSLQMVLNCQAILFPSETAGHFHLYLEIKLSWSQYEAFLAALFRAGVIEQDFYEMSLRNRMTTVTLPWIKRKEVLPEGY